MKLNFMDNSIRPLFFEYLFYKPADHSWNSTLGNKIIFIIIFLPTHLYIQNVEKEDAWNIAYMVHPLLNI